MSSSFSAKQWALYFLLGITVSSFAVTVYASRTDAMFLYNFSPLDWLREIHSSEQYLWIFYRMIIIVVGLSWFLVLKPVSTNDSSQFSWKQFTGVGLLACGLFTVWFYDHLGTEVSPAPVSIFDSMKYVTFDIAPKMIWLMLATTFLAMLLSRIGGSGFINRIRCLHMGELFSKPNRFHTVVRALSLLGVANIVFDVISPAHLPMFMLAIMAAWFIPSTFLLPIIVVFVSRKSENESEQREFRIDARYAKGWALFFWVFMTIYMLDLHRPILYWLERTML